MGIDVEKARKIVEEQRAKGGYDRYQFWQPGADLHERIKFLSEPRMIEQTEYGPLPVVDVERIDALNERRCMKLNKRQLGSAFGIVWTKDEKGNEMPKLDSSKAKFTPLTNKTLVMVCLGKVKSKKGRESYSFYIATEEEAAKQGVLSKLQQAKHDTVALTELQNAAQRFVGPGEE
jgi:hypothetical protein